VAISRTDLSLSSVPINIVYIRFSMLSGLIQIASALLEIPTLGFALLGMTCLEFPCMAFTKNYTFL